MKKVYELIIKGVLVAGLLVQCLAVSTVAYAADEEWLVTPAKLEAYSLQINTEGNQQTIQTQGFMQDGLIMVSAADLLNNTGFKIEESDSSKTSFLVERNEFLSSTIFNSFRFNKDNFSIDIFIKEQHSEFSIKESVGMPTHATVMNGYLYIPLEFMTTLLNYDVKYDYLTNVIVINSWNNKKEQVKQVKEFVNRYMNGASGGYSSDLSLYTTAFLEHDEDMIDTAFSNQQLPEPNLVLKDWNIRYLFFISHDEVMVKVPYLEVGKASKKVGGVWLRLIRTDSEWKVDSSTSWAQPLYLNDMKAKIKKLKINKPQKVKAIKKGLYSSFNRANAKKQTVEGTEVEYKTFPKNIEVLYADDEIAYVYTEYNWSFKQTDENLNKYYIASNKDFITMQKNIKGQWSFKMRYNLELEYSIPSTLIRGNYSNYKYQFMAFDNYYLQ